MRQAFLVRSGLLATACVALLMAARVDAEQREPFPYEFSMTPQEGPLDPSIEKRYTAQFRTCQEGAVSTLAIGACFTAEFARQDKVLNQTWRSTLIRIASKSRAPLLAAQRKWVAARDPFCRSMTEEFRGGTIAPVIYVNCRVEQTIRRTLWLKQLR